MRFSMATPIAHKGIVAGSKVMAMTMVDLLLRPDLIQPAKTYFTDVQLKNSKVISLLSEKDQPQIHLNRETMDRFRPEMSKFYYDASGRRYISISSASNFQLSSRHAD